MTGDSISWRRMGAAAHGSDVLCDTCRIHQLERACCISQLSNGLPRRDRRESCPRQVRVLPCTLHIAFKTDRLQWICRGWTGHYWAQPKVNSLRQILRQIFTNPAQAKAKGAVAREHVVAYYSLQVIGAQVLAEIHRVEGILQARVGAKARINFAGGDL